MNERPFLVDSGRTLTAMLTGIVQNALSDPSQGSPTGATLTAHPRPVVTIKNYTSKQPASKSAAQLQNLLAEHGARRVALDYHEGEVCAVEFLMEVGGRVHAFRLAVDVGGMAAALREGGHVPKGWSADKIRAQAERTAWKNKLDWMGAQLAEIAANQARMEQLLLGYVVTDDGRTAWERIEQGGNLLGSPADAPVLLDA